MTRDAADIDIVGGLTDDQRARAAQLYDDAFSAKFTAAVPDRKHRLALFERGFVGDFALTAHIEGQLVGLAGYSNASGALTGGIDFSLLRAQLGLGPSLKAAAILSLFERAPAHGQWVMDGIAVDSSWRGHGIGGRLLDHLCTLAIAGGAEQLRLDVIEQNPRARALYERKGFVATDTQRFAWLAWLIGFSASTTMVKPFHA